MLWARRRPLRDGNYIVALKENHPALLEDIRLYAQQEVLPRKTSELKAQGAYAMSLEKGNSPQRRFCAFSGRTGRLKTTCIGF